MSVAGIVAMVLVGFGTFFVLVAAFGLLRLSDVLMRMHASSKASTLGVILSLAGVAVWFGDGESIAQVVMICVFLLATAPVAAHAIARAAYRRGVELCEKTEIDELAEARGE
ncbi:MAG: monovalent cation/H(+) antiporter subunit G, partial [Planctomycetota bacterium]